MDKTAALSAHGVGEYGLLYTVLQGEVTCAHVHAHTHKYVLLCSTAASCTGQARHMQTWKALEILGTAFGPAFLGTLCQTHNWYFFLFSVYSWHLRVWNYRDKSIRQSWHTEFLLSCIALPSIILQPDSQKSREVLTLLPGEWPRGDEFIGILPMTFSTAEKLKQ